MNAYQLLIVDDEPYAHKLLESYCAKLDFIELTGNCYNGVEALNQLSSKKVDIMLLDIQMPDITGIELLDTIQKNATKVIMTTAYSDYALESYNHEQVVDYLLKPIKFVRFLKALERAKRILELEHHYNSPTPPIAKNNAQPTFICIKNNKKLYKISFHSLLYIQAYGNYLKFFLKNGEMKMVRNTISKMEKELPVHQFCRIHKSYIVNLDYVKQIEGNQVVLTKSTLPLGNSYNQYFKEKLITIKNE